MKKEWIIVPNLLLNLGCWVSHHASYNKQHFTENKTATLSDGIKSRKGRNSRSNSVAPNNSKLTNKELKTSSANQRSRTREVKSLTC